MPGGALLVAGPTMDVAVIILAVASTDMHFAGYTTRYALTVSPLHSVFRVASLTKKEPLIFPNISWIRK